MSSSCQVDFYLLGAAAVDAPRLACKLATMAWERGHSIEIVTGSEQAAGDLDQLLWEYPDGRFVPHARAGKAGDSTVPVRISNRPPQGDADVVINLTPVALEHPDRYRRLLEIVPHEESERTASRDKFRAYRAMGLAPKTHDIN